MDTSVGYLIILPDLIKDLLQRGGMSEYSGLVVDGDAVGNLTKEDDQLSPFGKEFVSLHLIRVLRQFRIRVGQGWNAVSIVFFSLPLIVTTLREKVAKCFVTV